MYPCLYAMLPVRMMGVEREVLKRSGSVLAVTGIPDRMFANTGCASACTVGTACNQGQGLFWQLMNLGKRMCSMD